MLLIINSQLVNVIESRPRRGLRPPTRESRDAGGGPDVRRTTRLAHLQSQYYIYFQFYTLLQQHLSTLLHSYI